MKSLFTINIILFIFIISSCKKEKIAPPVVTDPIEDVDLEPHWENYVSYGNNELQVMDVYHPSEMDIHTPLVIFVHGGGWSHGEKYTMGSYVKLVNDSLPQLALLNMDYRLCIPGEPIIEQQQEDIGLAIQHFKSRYPEWVGNIHFVGYSSGAHLSMFYAFRNLNNQNIKSVVNLLGHADFTIPNYQTSSITSNFLQNVFGDKTYAQDPELYVARSPITYVNSSTPAVLAVYTGRDNLVPYLQGERLEQKLTQFNVPNRYLFFSAEDHFDFQPETNQIIDNEILQFLKSNL